MKFERIDSNVNLNSADSDSKDYLVLNAYINKSLSSVEKPDLLKKLSRFGAVLLRGFDSNILEFSKLVENVTPSIAIDPARDFFAKNVQLVDSGTNEIGLHCENGTTPLLPEVVWFYCERAALSGSQTTLCDGIKVWNLLSPEARHILQKNRIRFSRNVSNALWVKYIKHHFSHLSDVNLITQKMLDEVFNRIDGAIARINSDGSLHLSHSQFTARPSFLNQEIAFANSLFTPSHNYEAPEISFENGEPIPAWLLNEAKKKCNLVTSEIDWQNGDIILIDNTRVMHGRRKISDTNRKLFTSLGFLSSDDKKINSFSSVVC